MSQNDLAVLTSDRIKEGFYKKMSRRFAWRAIKK